MALQRWLHGPIPFIAPHPLPALNIVSALKMARDDYRRALTKIVKLKFYACNEGDDMREFFAEPGKPFLAIVRSTPDDDLRIVNDNFVDPFWNVEIIESRGNFVGRFCWTDGPSIQFM
jgi:hypothetical protein